MADYTTENLELIVRYDGSKSSFDSSAEKASYINAKISKVVFITGSTASNASTTDKSQHIWVSNGTTHKYLSMTNITEIETTLSHIKGIKVDGTTYPASGGAILTLVGTGIPEGWGADKKALDITVNTDGTVTFDVSAIVDKIDGISSKVDGHEQSIIGHTNTINTLVGSDSGKSVRAIAEEEAGKVKTDLTSDDTDTTQAKTIGGAKKYADAVAASKASAAKTEAIQESKNYVDTELAGKADLENGKIPVGQLPDYILGQMLFGGTLDGGTTTQMTVTPTANLLDKIGKTEADLNTEGRLVITNTSSETYEGVYFISSINFGNTNVVNIPDVRIGDWIISTGTNWRKVDNTDAVSSVADLTGPVKASDLAKKLAETGDANELALKTEVDAKYTKPDEGIPESHLEEGVQTSLGKADSAIQGVTTETLSYIEVKTPKGQSDDSRIKAVNAKTATMQDTTDGLVTAADIRAYLAARLSVKVVS